MSALFFTLGMFGVFGAMMLAVYLPMCVWLYADYRRRGGRKSLRRYIDEEC